MKALLKNFHQSPRKVRLIADMIRGKAVPQAITLLTFQPQKSSPAILKLLNSAVANARQAGQKPEELVVKTITVDKGLALRRFAPRARGRAARFARTMSIVAIELGSVSAKAPKGKRQAAAAAAATEEKAAAKKVAKAASTRVESTRGGKTVKKVAKKTAKTE